jgi:uncharacterized protein YeaO (DUF488 family)
MSLHASRARLAALTKDLSGKWELTKEHWKDSKSREFEQKYMDELMAGVNRAVTSIQELDKIITKVRNDCE